MALRHQLHTPLRFLLAAAMLVWGAVPPPVCHAHEGGVDSGHRHSGFAAHHDIHHALPDPTHHGAMTLDASTLDGDGLVTHHHYQLLGLEFQLPCDGEDCDEDETSEPLLIGGTRGSSAISAGGDRFSGQHLCGSPQASVQCAVVAALPIHFPRVIASLPLCDSARLERTGVRLA